MSTIKTIQAHQSRFSSIDEFDENTFHEIETNEMLHLADGNEPPASIATRVGVEWNSCGLFVYFRGMFEQLRLPLAKDHTLNQGKTYRLWELSDVYEVFIGIRARETRMYKEFQIAPDGQWFDSDVNRQLGMSNHYWHSSFRCKSFVDKEFHIWSAILELPWSCFGLQKKQEVPLDVNFYRASGKRHGDELLSWSPTGYGEKCFHRPEHFGSIVCVE